MSPDTKYITCTRHMIINIKCSVLSDSIRVGAAALCRVCFHHLGFPRHVIMGNTLSFQSFTQEQNGKWRLCKLYNIKSTWFCIIKKYILYDLFTERFWETKMVLFYGMTVKTPIWNCYFWVLSIIAYLMDVTQINNNSKSNNNRSVREQTISFHIQHWPRKHSNVSTSSANSEEPEPRPPSCALSTEAPSRASWLAASLCGMEPAMRPAASPFNG